MRESFAKCLQEGAEDVLTNGEHIIRTLNQRAKDGDMKAIEYVLDRMGENRCMTPRFVVHP